MKPSSILTSCFAVVCLTLELFGAKQAIAGVTYPPPFTDSVNSVFGPRQENGKPVHTGIDYKQDKGTAIPAAEAGYVNRIADDHDNCGIRLYLVTDDSIEIGYCHLFTKTQNSEYTSGSFTLLKKVQFTLAIPIGLRATFVTRKCNVILNNTLKIALIPKDCGFMVGRTIIHNKITYTLSNRVSNLQLIAPVGNSGSASATAPHLHLNYGFGKDNPLFVIAHPDGEYCARLTDAGTSSSACDPVPVPPTIAVTTLSSRKYFELRVDSTGRLDLDQINLNVSTNPVQNFNLRYGGTPTTNPQVNGSADLKAAISFSCDVAPEPGKILICPIKWAGQQVPSSRLETRFRIGVDPATFPPGNYQITATLSPVTGTPINISLPFIIAGQPTATLLVPDLQTNWTGLPATISLTDLVVTPIATFQISGNSTTCGSGERGSPLYSNSVPASATFYAARTVLGVPYQSNGPGVNRRNCSSFVAVQMVPNPSDPSQLKRRIWINATGRGQQFGGPFPLDWESQIRFDSGDPWNGTGRSCVGGTVANAGFFGAAWSSSTCSANLSF